MDLPTPVAGYLLEQISGRHFPAWFEVDEKGCLIAAGGDTAGYGLSGLSAGDPVADKAYWLHGLLPLKETPHVLPDMMLENGRVADVHLFRPDSGSGGGQFILLLDATEETRRRGQLKQKGNELNLLRERLARLWGLSGADGGENAARAVLNLEPGGRRMELTVLWARIHGIGADAPPVSAQSAFERLGRAQRAVLHAAAEAGGVPFRVSGADVAALFGLISANASESAFRAAVRMRGRIFELSALPEVAGAPELSVRVGLAKGPVLVDAPEIQGPEAVRALGAPVDVAAGLAGAAEPSGILGEAAVFRAAGVENRAETVTTPAGDALRLRTG